MITPTSLGNESTPDGLSYAVTDGRSVGEIVVLAFIVGIVQLLALFGNALVITCIYTYRRLRSEVGSVFIVNLSVTDMMNSVVVITSSFYSVVHDGWGLGDAWCDIVCCMNYTLIIVSMLTLCFISMDRYMAVVYALRYQVLMTKKIAGVLIAWAWFQGMCFGLAPVFFGWIRFDYWEIVCAIQWHVDNDRTLIYVIVAFVVCFLLPGVILCVFYCKVMSVAKGHVQHRKAILGTQATRVANVPDIDIHIDNGEALDCEISHISDLSAEVQNGDASEDKRVVNTHDTVEEIYRNTSETTLNQNLHLPLSSRQNNEAWRDVEASLDNEFRHPSTSNIFISEATQNGLPKNNTDSPHRPLHIVSTSTPFSSSYPTSLSPSPLPSAIILQPHPKPATQTLSLNKCNTIRDTTKTRRVGLDDDVGLNHNGNISINIPPSTSPAITPPLTPRRPKSNKNNHYSASSKALRSLLIVVLAYFICMTPFSVTKLYKVIDSSPAALPGYVNVVASIFQYCSSAMNPLIYGIFRRDFQQAFRQLIRKVKRSFHDGGWSSSFSE